MKKNFILFALITCTSSTFYAQSSSSLNINDTRAINDLPSYFEFGIRADFKERNTIGVPGGGLYSTNVTIAPWEDTENSGGANHQLNFNDGGLFYRKAYPLDPQWGSWQKLLMANAEGNVGIGIENAGFQTRLHVKENGSSNNTWRGRIIASGDLNAVVLGEFNGKAWFGAHNSLLNAWSDLIIQAEGGNVGIGTINPAVKFDVVSNDVAAFFKSNSNSVPVSVINAGNSISSIGFKGSTSANEYNVRVGADGNDLISYTGNVERMRINSLGNIGIGIVNPSNRLDVNGTIHSKEVKVDMNGWPDFVFKKEYRIPTLEEVEKHIAQKGHLENIPDEKEVLKNGINLGEMNSKLLHKIEELTLYMIEQEKKTQELQNIISEQNKRLEKLEKKL